MMISQLFVLSQRGDNIVFRDCNLSFSLTLSQTTHNKTKKQAPQTACSSIECTANTRGSTANDQHVAAIVWHRLIAFASSPSCG